MRQSLEQHNKSNQKCRPNRGKSISLLGLLWARVGRSPRTARWAVPLAVVLALTVAQPFGIVAKRVSGPPVGTKAVGETSIHIARIAGVVPILPFVLYRQNILGPIGDQSPTAMLKARSWFWLPVLTNSTAIKGICSNDVTVPCWGGSEDSVSGQSNTISLREKDGRYYITLYSRLGPRFLAPSSYTWELAPGIASTAGLTYWALTAVLVPTALATARRRNKPDANATVPV